MKTTPLWSLTKRGKLGIDTFLIAFAMLGSMFLPWYFYQKFKENKKIIINSRKVDPKIISKLDEES